MRTCRWKMDKPCTDCPFNPTGPGAHLRRTLGRARMDEIRRALRSDEHFTCHKTTVATGNGTNLICAGALAFQEKAGVSSNLQRIMERLDAIYGAVNGSPRGSVTTEGVE